jgi:hypothetical protein
MLDRIGATDVKVLLDLDESTAAYALVPGTKPPAKRSASRRTKS